MAYSLKTKREASEGCQLLNGTLPLPKSKEDEKSLLSIIDDHSAGIWVQTRKKYGYFNFTSSSDDENYVAILRTYIPGFAMTVCWYNFSMKKLTRLY